MSTSPTWKSGGCLCGAVQFSVASDQIAGAAHCHCTDCQRATGSAFASFCFVPDAAFRADAGEAKGFTVQGSSGGEVTRFFCPDCGSQLYSQVAVMPGVRFVKAGSLDDMSWMDPKDAYWCDSAPPWVQHPSDVREHAKNPG